MDDVCGVKNVRGGRIGLANGRELNYDYGSGTIGDKISRPESLVDDDGTTVLASGKSGTLPNYGLTGWGLAGRRRAKIRTD